MGVGGSRISLTSLAEPATSEIMVRSDGNSPQQSFNEVSGTRRHVPGRDFQGSLACMIGYAHRLKQHAEGGSLLALLTEKDIAEIKRIQSSSATSGSRRAADGVVEFVSGVIARSFAKSVPFFPDNVVESAEGLPAKMVRHAALRLANAQRAVAGAILRSYEEAGKAVDKRKEVRS